MKIASLILIAILIFIFAGPVLALDTSYDTGKDTKVDQEVNRIFKKSIEQKNTTGNKNSRTRSTGTDRQDSETVKSIGEAKADTSAEVTLPLEAVFIDRIAGLETAGQEPFASCRIASAPKLGRDFGLSAEMRSGVIDEIKAEYLSKAAQSNVYVRDIADEPAIKAYRDCLAQYGAIVAQAYLYLTSDLGGIKGSVSKAKDGTINVRGMGYDDFIALADAALLKASQTLSNITIISMRDRVINSQSPCQFDRSTENIKCGPSLLILGTKPELFISGIQMYGEKFAGYAGAYKINRAWSYSSALEKLKSTARYAKFASEISQYADELEAHGRTKEATIARKTAVSLVTKSEQKASPSKHAPGIE